jgi:PAS domain S-box-containing protein
MIGIIGQRLRWLRKSVFLSRQEIERKHNISANTLKVWEAGKTEIGILRLVNYLNIFKDYGISPSVETLLEGITNDYQEKVTSHSNDSIYNLNLQNKKDLQLISDSIISTIAAVLKEKDEVFRALVDNLPLKIVVKDENNVVLRLNAPAASALGGTISDFEGKNIYNLFPKIAKKYHEDDLEVLKTNKPMKTEEEFITLSSESSKRVFINRIPIFNRKNKKMVLTIFENIA